MVLKLGGVELGSIEIWLRLGQLLVALLGFFGLIWTIHQKTVSDNRAEWWKRYTWAADLIREADDDSFRLGILHLNILVTSPLSTRTEQKIIQELAVEGVSGDNRGTERRADDDYEND